MSAIPLVHFMDAAKGVPLQRRLADAGISAQVRDTLYLEKLWFISKREAGARLEVSSKEFERACELLLEWDKEEALEGAVRCPHCRSFRVEYPQFTRKSFIPNVLLGFAATIGLEKHFYFQDCHYTWPKNAGRPLRVRPHSAPSYFIEGINERKDLKR